MSTAGGVQRPSAQVRVGVAWRHLDVNKAQPSLPSEQTACACMAPATAVQHSSISSPANTLDRRQ